MHDDIWTKWRAAEKPENWKVMTKVDHTKRTAEYVALLEKQNPNGMRKTKNDPSNLPEIERPAALPMNMEIVPAEYLEKPKDKRKRKKRKNTKSGLDTDNAEANIAAEEAEDDEPSSKRRA